MKPMTAMILVAVFVLLPLTILCPAFGLIDLAIVGYCCVEGLVP